MKTGLTDMAKSPEKAMETATPVSVGEQDKYPWGLRITLTHEELEKLGVDKSDWEVGDTFHLQAFAKITGISENQKEGGESDCCVSLQITHLAGPENEEEEGEESEDDLEEHGYSRVDEAAEHLPLHKHGYRHSTA